MKNFVIVTGPSGSGLSSAEYVFEELGYCVIKNTPSSTIDVVIDDLVKNSKINDFCLMFSPKEAVFAMKIIEKRDDIQRRLILLNCDKDEIVKRYALTRHVHPLVASEHLSLPDAIEKDIESLLTMVNVTNLYVDTTSLQVKQLRVMLYKFLENIDEDKMTSITFISFGLKNGIPQGLDTFIDVRSIPNPYWVDELKELTGEDEKVIEYMNSFEITKEVVDNAIRYLTKQFKFNESNGRASYVVGVACSGGQHRSTYVANLLKDHFAKEYRTLVIHRDTPKLNKEE